MDPDDSDYHSNTSRDQYESGSEDSYGSESGQSIILGEDADDHRQLSDASASDESPRKRVADDDPQLRPFKRQRNALNPDYLDLLNRAIEDAAHRVCLGDDASLPASQLGLTYWSPLEKNQFFEALSRLGKHDLPGIAQIIGTKSPIEVKHYLRVLHEAVLARRTQDSRSFLEPAEYPAAVELTPLCCHAQEEAADAVSIKQEARDNQREKDKWQQHWDITPRIAVELEKKPQDDGASNLAFAKLFHVSRWLKLSDRMFMNSSIPGSNWHNIDSRPPSIWATTLEDFHSLALSITRRLVQTTLFISMSRIRAKSVLVPGTRNIVRKKDVEAAIASLGLSHNSSDLWLKSARRLRLEVYENPPAEGDEEEEEPMTYDEVEAELADKDPQRAASIDSEAERVKPEPASSDDSDDSAEGSDNDQSVPKDEEERAVNREINEVLWYSAVGIRDLQSTRRALKMRIEAERKQERQADAVDEYASYNAETEMWELLQKAPPVERPRMPNPARLALHRSNLDVETLYPMNRTWADDLEYHAEWETLQKPVDPVSHDNEDNYD
ncbi:hypothetical protein NLG97_g4459 [Lecanicillium saksenae]|uniref:Uncharacterized protein n=1 Tax=Lecanicillium saksenae TaxID=468837 RepID=A0ACC1QWG1_9HYPO|nr:hypothetical protein NLG97_g4459 [Lecanicillium saksenae]